MKFLTIALFAIAAVAATPAEDDLRRQLEKASQERAVLGQASVIERDAAAARVAVIEAKAAAAKAEYTTALVLLQNDDLRKSESHSNLATWIGFMTLLAGFIWKAYTDSRDHRWVMENTLRTNHEVLVHRLNENEEFSIAAEHRRVELGKIEEVGADARKAYDAANEVNQKIESIGVKMADDKPL